MYSQPVKSPVSNDAFVNALENLILKFFPALPSSVASIEATGLAFVPSPL